MVILDQRPTTTEKEEEEELDVGMNFQIQFLPFTWQTINERQAVILAGMTNHSFTEVMFLFWKVLIRLKLQSQMLTSLVWLTLPGTD